jgi:adenylylsulfate kinase
MESNSRSIAKAISYRLLGSLSTALIVFVFSGNPAVSLGVGAADMVAKIALYYLHERLWNHISFGRQKPPEYEI